MATRYVVGFLFTADASRIVLIQKRRPAWQAGLYNGVGGKVEGGETALLAMIRECQEEIDLLLAEQEWEQFARLATGESTVDFFRAFTNASLQARSKTDEQISIFEVTALPEQLVPDLRWLIPAALHHSRSDGVYLLRILLRPRHPP